MATLLVVLIMAQPIYAQQEQSITKQTAGFMQIQKETDTNTLSQNQSTDGAVATTDSLSSGLTAVAYPNAVALSWESVPGAKEYNAYYKLSADSEYISSEYSLELEGNSFVFEGLESASSYDFKVAATDGTTETESGTISAATLAAVSFTVKPSSPTSVHASWSAVEGVSDYELSYTDTKTNVKKSIDLLTATEVSITDLSKGGSYTFVLAAFDDDINKLVMAPSPTESLTVQLPLEWDLSAVVGPHQVVLAWAAVTGASSYKVEYKKSTDSSYTTAVEAVADLTYTVTGLTDDVAYDFRVTPNIGTALFVSATPTLGPLTGLTVTGTYPNAVGLSWNAIAGVTRYMIAYKTSNDYSFKPRIMGSRTSEIISKLEPATAYEFQVTAYDNKDGRFVISKTAVATISATTLPEPVFTVVPISPTSVRASWEPVKNAADYALYYGISNGFLSGYKYLDVKSVTEFTVSGLKSGEKYSFTWLAYTDDGGLIVYTYITVQMPEAETDMDWFRFCPDNSCGICPEGHCGQIPSTGFPSGRFTRLALQPAALNYKPLNISLDLPSVDIKADLVQVPEENDSWSVEWLGNNAGLLEGSALPGEGPCFVVGHNHLNSMAAGPFLYISTMQANDRIFIKSTDGKLLTFRVAANELIDAGDMSQIVAESAKYKNPLVLVTCENESLDGGYVNRRVIFAEMM